MVDNNVTHKRIDRLIDDDKDLFLFPVWQHNSFVKSVDMQSTVPSSMVMSTMYGSNVPVEEVEISQIAAIGPIAFATSLAP